MPWHAVVNVCGGRSWKTGDMCEGRVREGEDAPDNPWQIGRIIKVRKDGVMVVVNFSGSILMQKVPGGVRRALADPPPRPLMQR